MPVYVVCLKCDLQGMNHKNIIAISHYSWCLSEWLSIWSMHWSEVMFVISKPWQNVDAVNVGLTRKQKTGKPCRNMVIISTYVTFEMETIYFKICLSMPQSYEVSIISVNNENALCNDNDQQKSSICKHPASTHQKDQSDLPYWIEPLPAKWERFNNLDLFLRFPKYVS